jgi:hypothetical protein
MKLFTAIVTWIIAASLGNFCGNLMSKLKRLQLTKLFSSSEIFFISRSAYCYDKPYDVTNWCSTHSVAYCKSHIIAYRETHIIA